MVNTVKKYKLKRRRFFALCVASVGGLLTWRYVRSNDEHAIIAVLQNRLNYLHLDPQGLTLFANELSARNVISSSKLRLLDMAGTLYSAFNLSWLQNGITDKLHHGEERVVSQYLLSSDFFDNGADVSKTVHYREFYDPIAGTLPCRNPFTRPL